MKLDPLETLLTPTRPKIQDPLDPTRPETRNTDSMFKNKVNTTRVQTQDPRVVVIFVYANN